MAIPGPYNGIDITENNDNYGSSYLNALIICDPFNKSMISFRGFVSSFSYDMGKEIKEENSVIQNFYTFASYNGTFAIKISIDIPAANPTEAKNNLAKIAHLQSTIMPSIVKGERGTFTQHQIVYFSNLINNGVLHAQDASKDFGFIAMKRYGLYSWIEEVTYAPDFSSGFFETTEGLLPKYYKLDITINPDTEYGSALTSTYFLKPFNQNGHYASSDSNFFPFLVPVGSKNLESHSFSEYFNEVDVSINSVLSMDIINKRDIQKSKGSLIYFALPIDDPTTELGTKQNGELNRPSSTDNNYKIRRELVFQPFIESFSRKVSVHSDRQNDQGQVLDQTLTVFQNFKPMEYELSFQVPASNLTEAKYNASKIQYLMRMFYTRVQTERNTDTELLYSLKVFVPSYIGKSNLETSDLDLAYKNGLTLQTSNISIDIDIQSGFYTSGNFKYPKAYKVTATFKDINFDNQKKILKQGTLVGGGVARDSSGKIRTNNDGSIVVTGSFPSGPTVNVDNPKQTGYLNNNIVYWKPGG